MAAAVMGSGVKFFIFFTSTCFFSVYTKAVHNCKQLGTCILDVPRLLKDYYKW